MLNRMQSAYYLGIISMWHCQQCGLEKIQKIE